VMNPCRERGILVGRGLALPENLDSIAAETVGLGTSRLCTAVRARGFRACRPLDVPDERGLSR
jgi:hypothetical protein